MDVRPGLDRMPRVLVVDDVREVRQLFAEFLGRSGMHVTQADGGPAALAAVRRAKPDLVVTDITMPKMDGLELCRRMRAEPITSNVPIIVVGGGAAAEGAAAWDAGGGASTVMIDGRDRLDLSRGTEFTITSGEPRNQRTLPSLQP